MMVGRAVSLNIDRPEAKYRDLRLEVKGLTCRDHEGVKTLDDVSFQAFGGEILGIAGIAGSGQKELLEAIAGLQAAEAGSVLYYPPHPNSDIAGYHVPVDRDGEELVGKTPCRSAVWACPWPSCRRTAWAWAWWRAWTWWTT